MQIVINYILNIFTCVPWFNPGTGTGNKDTVCPNWFLIIINIRPVTIRGCILSCLLLQWNPTYFRQQDACWEAGEIPARERRCDCPRYPHNATARPSPDGKARDATRAEVRRPACCQGVTILADRMRPGCIVPLVEFKAVTLRRITVSLLLLAAVQ